MKRPYTDFESDLEKTIQTDNYPKFIVIKSLEEKPLTSLSPFVIEKQIEALIGTPKTVKKLKNQTLLIETTRKTQSESLLKIKTFFNIKVAVSEHKTLNSSKGIIKDRALKGESEEDIVNYLKPQGVIAAKRFKIKKDYSFVETNTVLLTFNSATIPANLKIFYRIIPVELYIPNPLRCFNCQKFGHHESSCPVDPGSVCERCGTGNHDHHTSQCQNEIKCANCGKDHLSKSNLCEIWKKEKEIIKIKVTKNITYPEARKLFELVPKPVYSKIVQSSFVKPATKTTSTQYDENDFAKHQTLSVPNPLLKHLKHLVLLSPLPNHPNQSFSLLSLHLDQLNILSLLEHPSLVHDHLNQTQNHLKDSLDLDSRKLTQIKKMIPTIHDQTVVNVRNRVKKKKINIQTDRKKGHMTPSNWQIRTKAWRIWNWI